MCCRVGANNVTLLESPGQIWSGIAARPSIPTFPRHKQWETMNETGRELALAKKRRNGSDEKTMDTTRLSHYVRGCFFIQHCFRRIHTNARSCSKCSTVLTFTHAVLQWLPLRPACSRASCWCRSPTWLDACHGWLVGEREGWERNKRRRQSST
jgi:hypothetical protein